MKTEFHSFREFYPYYLKEHRHPVCRRLHFVGSWLVLGILFYSLSSANYWALWFMSIAGYGFAWVGHFFFEHNKPATFKYPLYSLIGDWVMFKDILIGRLKC